MKTYQFLAIILIGSASTMFILWMWSLRKSGKKFWKLIFLVRRPKNHHQMNIIEPARHDAANDVPAMPLSGTAEPSSVISQLRAEPEATNNQSKHAPNHSGKPKKNEPNYEDLFLVNDGGRDRVSAYIDRDLHDKFKRLLSIAAPGVTLTSFINNILDHHLEQHRDVISEMYNDKFKKPF